MIVTNQLPAPMRPIPPELTQSGMQGRTVTALFATTLSLLRGDSNRPADLLLVPAHGTQTRPVDPQSNTSRPDLHPQVGLGLPTCGKTFKHACPGRQPRPGTQRGNNKRKEANNG